MTLAGSQNAKPGRKKKDDNTIQKIEEANFAEGCVTAYRMILGYEKFDGHQPAEDVRQVAIGLALIRELLDGFVASMTESAAMPGSGIREAYAIIDHLTSGRAHPVAKHISGLKSARFRPNRK